MGRRRTLLLRPEDAKTEGERLLRLLLRSQSYAAIARRLLCTETAVRNYARGAHDPSLQLRARFREVFGWNEEVWASSPSEDAYAGAEPATVANPGPPTTRDVSRA